MDSWVSRRSVAPSSTPMFWRECARSCCASSSAVARVRAGMISTPDITGVPPSVGTGMAGTGFLSNDGGK